jgi:superfamily II DNA or RNA helicase
MTATPIRNDESDIWALLFTCGYSDLNNPRQWDRSRFVGDVKNMIYNITYDKIGIVLPEKIYHNYDLIMSDKELAIYLFYLNDLRDNYNGFLVKVKTFAVILSLFSLLRRLCIAAYLINDHVTKTERKNQNKAKSNPVKEKRRVYLNQSSDPNIAALELDINNIYTMGYGSTKIRKIVEIVINLLEDNRKTNANNRILIFSSYVTVLELIIGALEYHLRSNSEYLGLPIGKDLYRLLTGKVNIDDRNTYMNEFNNGRYPILFMVYKIGALGWNLQTANHVIPADPWWTDIVEYQAEGRAWRTGQTRNVHVHRIIMKGTIEKQIRLMAMTKNSNSQFYYGHETARGPQKLPSLDKETLGRILYEALSNTDQIEAKDDNSNDNEGYTSKDNKQSRNALSIDYQCLHKLTSNVSSLSTQSNINDDTYDIRQDGSLGTIAYTRLYKPTSGSIDKRRLNNGYGTKTKNNINMERKNNTINNSSGNTSISGNANRKILNIDMLPDSFDLKI